VTCVRCHVDGPIGTVLSHPGPGPGPPDVLQAVPWRVPPGADDHHQPAVCQLKEGEMELPQLVQCSVCRLEFCSACRDDWHKGHACQDNIFLPGETSSFYNSDDDTPIKRCPKCKDDFLLIHYDEGPCRNKLGLSRASVIWHRTQVVGIFAGFGLLLLLASPFLLIASPFVLCCKCKCSKGDDDPLPT
ncbi:unnamed protein product, partial [Coregonus sp. 'balchen']